MVIVSEVPGLRRSSTLTRISLLEGKLGPGAVARADESNVFACLVVVLVWICGQSQGASCWGQE